MSATSSQPKELPNFPGPAAPRCRVVVRANLLASSRLYQPACLTQLRLGKTAAGSAAPTGHYGPPCGPLRAVGSAPQTAGRAVGSAVRTVSSGRNFTASDPRSSPCRLVSTVDPAPTSQDATLARQNVAIPGQNLVRPALRIGLRTPPISQAVPGRSRNQVEVNVRDLLPGRRTVIL